MENNWGKLGTRSSVKTAGMRLEIWLRRGCLLGYRAKQPESWERKVSYKIRNNQMETILARRGRGESERRSRLIWCA